MYFLEIEQVEQRNVEDGSAVETGAADYWLRRDQEEVECIFATSHVSIVGRSASSLHTSAHADDCGQRYVLPLSDEGCA